MKDRQYVRHTPLPPVNKTYVWKLVREKSQGQESGGETERTFESWSWKGFKTFRLTEVGNNVGVVLKSEREKPTVFKRFW